MDNSNQQPTTVLPPIEQPVAPSSSSRSKKLIILISLVLLVVVVSGAYMLMARKNQSSENSTKENSTNSSLTPTQNLPASTSVNFQTVVLATTDIRDSQTNLYLSDANKVYKVGLDGSQPQEVASLPHNISTISLLANGTLLINTDNSKYEKVVNKQSGDPDYKQVVVGYGYWMLAPNSANPEEIDEQKYQALTRLKDNTNGEKIYTKELSNGQADILLDKLDGTVPTKIGSLKEKPLKVQVCEVGDNCLQMKYPGEFYPSFDGSYLLSKPPGGGGLGEPGIVISRDGSKAYKIDFYWYVSSAIWIGNNKLLTKGQDGKQKIVTFKEDVTFSESPLQQDLGGYFSQNTLSPSGKLLFVSDDAKHVSLYDLNQTKSVTIETLSEEQVRKQLNLLAEEIIEQRYYFIGWNKNSDKVLYASTTGAISSAHNNDRTIIREIKIYDVKSGKVYTAAKLNPSPSNPDDYLINGKPKADITHFAIK